MVRLRLCPLVVAVCLSCVCVLCCIRFRELVSLQVLHSRFGLSPYLTVEEPDLFSLPPHHHPSICVAIHEGRNCPSRPSSPLLPTSNPLELPHAQQLRSPGPAGANSLEIGLKPAVVIAALQLARNA